MFQLMMQHADAAYYQKNNNSPGDKVSTISCRAVVAIKLSRDENCTMQEWHWIMLYSLTHWYSPEVYVKRPHS